MNSSGVLLVLAGVWVVAQVLGGDALNRVGIGSDMSVDGPTGIKIKGGPIQPSVDRSAAATVGRGSWQA